MVVTFNNLVEEVREGLRWQKEDEEKMVEVECDREDVAMDQDSLMEYGEELESDLSFIEYPDTPEERMRVNFFDIAYDDTSEDSDESIDLLNVKIVVLTSLILANLI